MDTHNSVDTPQRILRETLEKYKPKPDLNQLPNLGV